MSGTNDFNQKIIEEFRVNPVMYREDGDRLVVFASKAGAPTNPDW